MKKFFGFVIIVLMFVSVSIFGFVKMECYWAVQDACSNFETYKVLDYDVSKGRFVFYIDNSKIVYVDNHEVVGVEYNQWFEDQYTKLDKGFEI